MTMEVQLLDRDGKFLCILNNDSALFGAYPVEDNMRLHVGLIFPHLEILFIEAVEKQDSFSI